MSLRTSILSLTTAAAVTAGAFTAPVATAASYPSAGSVPVAQLDVNQPDGGLAYVYAEPVMESDIDLMVRQIRAIRARAWDTNLSIENVPLRELARRQGLGSREAYVNSISWSRGLEHAALQRAAEENAGPQLDHERVPGVECWTVTDAFKSAENINYLGADEAIDGWADEWSNKVSGHGITGHLDNMIAPTHRYFAVAEVGTATAGLFSDGRFENSAENRTSTRLDQGRHAFPIAVPTSSIDDAELFFSGGSTPGAKGSIGLRIEGFNGARLGIPAASPSSSDPDILQVNDDGTYEAKSEGTATITLDTYELRNGQPTLSGNTVTKQVTVKKKSVIGDLSSGGTDVGAIMGIITAVLALLGVASQVSRQFGLLR
ncbi:CAP domain-containing protein [Corynebacterium sp. LaCa116]|uniref:CAP domain-containing protein n=1 Tax=Corynebacterium sp. LaCa116 TaxID=3391423 RepID=UPI0039893642